MTSQSGILNSDRRSEIPRILLSALLDTPATMSTHMPSRVRKYSVSNDRNPSLQILFKQVPQIEEVEDSSETTDRFLPFW